MATLQLTDDEVREVRLLLGAQFTDADLTDEQVISGITLGAATDYVFERVREDLDLERLTDAERSAAERFRDETAEDIAAFINMVLKPPQRAQMRRAVIFRTAGLCASLVRRSVGQNLAGISIREQVVPAVLQQDALFQRCEEEIDRLRNAFPDDAFLSNKQRVEGGFNMITLLTTVGN